MKPLTERSPDAGLRRLQAIVDNALDGLITADEGGSIETFNPACEHIFGYRAEDVLGANLNILMPELTPSDYQGSAIREVSGRRKNGTVCPLELSASRFRLEDGQHYCVIIRDITQRQVIEKEAALLAAIVASSEDAIISKTLAGIIVTWNAGATHLFGYTASEAVGQHINLIIPPERRDEEQTIIAQVRAGKPIKHMETVRVGKDGRPIYIALTVSPVRDKDGNIIGASKIIRDITERRNAEIERQKLMDQLTESNTELERFAYVASHDMQEPVRMMMNFGKILATEYGDKLDAQGREYLALMTNSADRIHEMIDDLLDYARIDCEDRRMVIVDGARELNHVLKNLDALIMERGATVTFESLPPFQGNPVQIMRLMQNLIANAIKYQPPDNVPKVHVGVEDLGAAWRISVKDNGLGIDEAFRDKIFEPFRRLHSWEHIRGTGIGLAVCRKIVENHGGEMSVTSVPGQGSTFFITLPKMAVEKGRAA